MLELLVVVAILGVLSGGAVLAMTSIRDTAQQTTCAADAGVIDTAEEAAFVLGGDYLDEQGLVDAGYLKDSSALHDVTLAGSTYGLVPVGACDPSGSEVAAGAPDDRAAEGSTVEAAAVAEARSKAAAQGDEGATAAGEAEKLMGEKAVDQNAVDQKAVDQKAADDLKRVEEATQVEAEQRAEAAKLAEELQRAEDEKKAAAAHTSGCRKGQIDINAAEKKQLRQIAHIGGDEATRIVKQRPFKSVGQLNEVKGLTDGDVKQILEQDLACVG